MSKSNGLVLSKWKTSEMMGFPDANLQERAAKHFNNLDRLEKQFEWSYKILSEARRAWENPVKQG